MDDSSFPNPHPERPDMADAASLFEETAGAKPQPVPASPRPESTGDGYDLEHPHDPDSSAGAPVTPVTAGPSRKKTGSAATRDETRSKMALDPSEAVEQVWSRGAEWGGTIVLLALAGVVTLGSIYLLAQMEVFGLAVLVLFTGGLAMAVLSYPILITLERPVRVTPEQAVRDYFGALSHHAPHYRRMWLLLSAAGRVSSSYASFEGFRSYWKKRLDELKGEQASFLTPLKFQVDDFKSAKSAGLSEIEATYTIRVLVRGRQDAGPIHTIRVTSTLVKGPDRMWYLDRGTL